jgi:hypothetical protein
LETERSGRGPVNELWSWMLFTPRVRSRVKNNRRGKRKDKHLLESDFRERGWEGSRELVVRHCAMTEFEGKKKKVRQETKEHQIFSSSKRKQEK